MEMNLPKLEETILKKWKREKTFEKSVARRKNSPRFVFYEGPPTANGRPGLHHVLSRSFKDAVLRYKTMRGFFVPRRAGWDTHGLPVELEVEKELGLKSKKDIEKYGIARFNEACRKSVWRYQKEWEELTWRVGMWLDMEHPYITYETSYIETLWHIIKTWWQKGFLYKDYKVVPFCPRCGTVLSSHELAQGYKTTKDLSVYVKFPLTKESVQKLSQTASCKLQAASFLAWTTTPWTLPGNVALAVSPKVPYVLAKKGNEYYILAKVLAEKVLGEYETVKLFSGKELLGMKYESLFRFGKPEREKKIWEVVLADFVSTKEGTGIVHTAVAYGADDFELGKKENLAMLHLVDEQGKFQKEAKPFAGKFVKDADPLIVADLKKRNLLFKEELYEHEYPFCWRCSTPLLYYAKESWFVNMQKVKTKLLANNKKVNWIPEHLKEGRMGEWLKEVKDWTFSRERYWGTPLPVWECGKCQGREVIGSVKELVARQGSSNSYLLVRHGHSEKQVSNVMSSWPEKKKLPLTEKGIQQVRRIARQLKKGNVDLIISSDLLRAKQTAQILAKELGMNVAHDKRLREVDTGKMNGKKIGELRKIWGKKGETELEHYLRRFVDPLPGGESWLDVQKRMYEALCDLEKKHRGKTIVLVSHELPLTLLETTLKGLPRQEAVAFRIKSGIATGEMREVSFAKLPYTKDMELDLHRPYVDEITFSCAKCKGTMRRVKDVVDVWYDSGAMPFAQARWPFAQSQKSKVKSQKLRPPAEFPADYIVEAIDQTRGWFYTLLAVSTLLGYGPPYRNAISLGHVLDEKGEKMSKSKGNVQNPWDMADKYGMDAVRWYFFSTNHPWGPKLFAEKDLQQTLRKFILTLWNSFAFYEIYCSPRLGLGAPRPSLGKNVLDQWIVSRLHVLTADMTKRMDEYDITGASRALEFFVIDDLSLWYIRRSRNRFQNPRSKKELNEAVSTLRCVLFQTALLAAPFVPFLAEAVFERVGGKGSVHVQDWPLDSSAKGGLAQGKPFINKKLEQQMQEIRSIASKGLSLRAKAGLRVRQPLASVTVKEQLGKPLLELLKDELNVKEVVVSAKAKEDVELDTKITPRLKEEGLVRELLRHIQDMRKDAGYKPGQQAVMRYTGQASLISLIQKNEDTIQKMGGLKELLQGDRPKQVFDVEKEIMVEGRKLWLGIRKT